MDWLTQFPQMDDNRLRDIKKMIDEAFRGFTRAYGDGIETLFEPLRIFMVQAERFMTGTPWIIVFALIIGIAWAGSRSGKVVPYKGLLDEAIRLADHIAVMRDGAIVQTATPEELVLHPATEYVAEFTRHIPRAKVVRLRTAARPVASSDFAGDLPSTALVADVADQIEASGKPFRVVDEEGQILGEVNARVIIDILIGRELTQ